MQRCPAPSMKIDSKRYLIWKSSQTHSNPVDFLVVCANYNGTAECTSNHIKEGNRALSRVMRSFCVSALPSRDWSNAPRAWQNRRVVSHRFHHRKPTAPILCRRLPAKWQPAISVSSCSWASRYCSSYLRWVNRKYPTRVTRFLKITEA